MCRAVEALREQALVPLMTGICLLLSITSPPRRASLLLLVGKYHHAEGAVLHSRVPSANQGRSSTAGLHSDGHSSPHLNPPFTLDAHLHRVFHKLIEALSEALKTLRPETERLSCVSHTLLPCFAWRCAFIGFPGARSPEKTFLSTLGLLCVFSSCLKQEYIKQYSPSKGNGPGSIIYTDFIGC